MKKWAKSSPALVALFDRVVPAAAAVERRQMFGYPCAFVNGNMFAGLQEERLILRLGERDRAAFLALEGAAGFAPMGRPMREYVVAPGAILEDERALAAWMKRALAHARALPRKRARPRPPRRKAAGARRRR